MKFQLISDGGIPLPSPGNPMPSIQKIVDSSPNPLQGFNKVTKVRRSSYVLAVESTQTKVDTYTNSS